MVGKKVKKRQRRSVPLANAYVHASFNNTIVTVTDLQGNTLCWSSAGSVGFKGTRKSTSYAAQIVAERAAKRARECGVESLKLVSLSGLGQGREAAVRALAISGLDVQAICDATPVPHNGCRPPKRRRV